MARFVMIRIPDNDEAQAFVDALQKLQVMYAKPHPTLEDQHTVCTPRTEWEVTALWADPTKLCECHPFWDTQNPMLRGRSALCNPVRSANFGWLVCPQCKKPHPHQFQHPRNLLFPDEKPSTRTYYLGFRADRKGQANENP